MHPELLHIGPVTIYSYGLMMATAFLTCYFLLNWEFKKIGAPRDFASNLIFWAAIGGILGAKIFYLFEHLPELIADPAGMIFSGAGLVFHGGLIGGTITVIIILRKNNLSILKYGDIIGPVLLVGQGIGRIGCFLAGCCHGSACDLPWAVTFPYASPPADYPVHPTQLYETLLNFSFFFVLVFLIRPRTKKYGVTFGIYLLFAGLERFLLEFIRVNPKDAWGLSHYQYSSLAIFLVGVVVLAFLTRDKEPGNQSSAGTEESRN